jgi:tRNA(Arg) A34 adenosine deaminase TadA
MSADAISPESMITDADLDRLRQAIALSRDAVSKGELPFGAVIAAADGRLLAEAISTEIGDGDWTCHAETNAVRLATVAHPRETLSGATIYASAEPCIMCASAIFYSGIRRIVYAFGEPRLRQLLATREDTVGLGFGCREVLARAAEPVEILGPVLEDEAAEPQMAYWSPSG